MNPPGAVAEAIEKKPVENNIFRKVSHTGVMNNILSFSSGEPKALSEDQKRWFEACWKTKVTGDPKDNALGTTCYKKLDRALGMGFRFPQAVVGMVAGEFEFPS